MYLTRLKLDNLLYKSESETVTLGFVRAVGLVKPAEYTLGVLGRYSGTVIFDDELYYVLVFCKPYLDKTAALSELYRVFDKIIPNVYEQ